MTLKGLVGPGSSHGWYQEWRKKSKDARHREDCAFFDIFPEFYSSDESSPPWRLGKEELHTCDLRVRSMWWPHYMDPLSYDDHSFWTHSDRIWKCAHKSYTLLVIIPTCLYGFVPQVHTALLVLLSALRRLGGQVFSLEESRRRGFIPGLRNFTF